MASTYTNTGLELIGDGEQPSSWGDSTNDNLEMLDVAISQSADITMPDSNDTITLANGAISDARAAFLRLTGTLTASRVLTIAPSDMQKMYYVENATTGDFNVEIAQGDGTGGKVTVAQDGIVQVFCDGAGSSAEVVKMGAYGVGAGETSQFFISPAEMHPISSTTPFEPTLVHVTGGTMTYVVWEFRHGTAGSPTWGDYVEFTVAMPNDWDGTEIRFSPIWSAPASGNVNSDMRGVVLTDGTALSTAVAVSDLNVLTTIPTADKAYYAEKSLAFPLDTASAGELITFNMRRDMSGAEDANPGVAHLHGVMFYYNGSA